MTGDDSTSTRRSAFGFSAIDPEPWMASAMCAQTDPDAFYPKKGGIAEARSARRVCQGCPVRDECLEHAPKMDERHGIWGGMTARQRRELRRRAS